MQPQVKIGALPDGTPTLALQQLADVRIAHFSRDETKEASILLSAFNALACGLMSAKEKKFSAMSDDPDRMKVIFTVMHPNGSISIGWLQPDIVRRLYWVQNYMDKLNNKDRTAKKLKASGFDKDSLQLVWSRLADQVGITDYDSSQHFPLLMDSLRMRPGGGGWYTNASGRPMFLGTETEEWPEWQPSNNEYPFENEGCVIRAQALKDPHIYKRDAMSKWCSRFMPENYLGSNLFYLRAFGTNKLIDSMRLSPVDALDLITRDIGNWIATGEKTLCDFSASTIDLFKESCGQFSNYDALPFSDQKYAMDPVFLFLRIFVEQQRAAKIYERRYMASLIFLMMKMQEWVACVDDFENPSNTRLLCLVEVSKKGQGKSSMNRAWGKQATKDSTLALTGTRRKTDSVFDDSVDPLYKFFSNVNHKGLCVEEKTNKVFENESLKNAIDGSGFIKQGTTSSGGNRELKEFWQWYLSSVNMATNSMAEVMKKLPKAECDAWQSRFLHNYTQIGVMDEARLKARHNKRGNVKTVSEAEIKEGMLKPFMSDLERVLRCFNVLLCHRVVRFDYHEAKEFRAILEDEADCKLADLKYDFRNDVNMHIRDYKRCCTMAKRLTLLGVATVCLWKLSNREGRYETVQRTLIETLKEMYPVEDGRIVIRLSKFAVFQGVLIGANYSVGENALMLKRVHENAKSTLQERESSIADLERQIEKFKLDLLDPFTSDTQKRDINAHLTHLRNSLSHTTDMVRRGVVSLHSPTTEAFWDEFCVDGPNSQWRNQAIEGAFHYEEGKGTIFTREFIAHMDGNEEHLCGTQRVFSKMPLYFHGNWEARFFMDPACCTKCKENCFRRCTAAKKPDVEHFLGGQETRVLVPVDSSRRTDFDIADVRKWIESWNVDPRCCDEKTSQYNLRFVSKAPLEGFNRHMEGCAVLPEEDSMEERYTLFEEGEQFSAEGEEGVVATLAFLAGAVSPRDLPEKLQECRSFAAAYVRNRSVKVHLTIDDRRMTRYRDFCCRQRALGRDGLSNYDPAPAGFALKDGDVLADNVFEPEIEAEVTLVLEVNLDDSNPDARRLLGERTFRFDDSASKLHEWAKGEAEKDRTESGDFFGVIFGEFNGSKAFVSDFEFPCSLFVGDERQDRTGVVQEGQFVVKAVSRLRPAPLPASATVGHGHKLIFADDMGLGAVGYIEKKRGEFKLSRSKGAAYSEHVKVDGRMVPHASFLPGKTSTVVLRKRLSHSSDEGEPFPEFDAATDLKATPKRGYSCVPRTYEVPFESEIKLRFVLSQAHLSPLDSIEHIEAEIRSALGTRATFLRATVRGGTLSFSIAHRSDMTVAEQVDGEWRDLRARAPKRKVVQRVAARKRVRLQYGVNDTVFKMKVLNEA